MYSKLENQRCTDYGETGEGPTKMEFFNMDPLDDNSQRCYMPSPITKLYLTPEEPSPPPSLFTTPKVIQSSFDCFRFATTNEYDWLERNKDLLATSADLSSKTKNVSTGAFKAAQDQLNTAEQFQKASTQALLTRANEVKTKRNDFYDLVKRMQNEMANTDQMTLRLKKFENFFLTPEYINSECQFIRCGRPNSELIRDNVERELQKETYLNRELRHYLEENLHKLEQQQNANRCATQALEISWSEKFTAAEVDSEAAGLHNKSIRLMHYPEALTPPKGQSTEQSWRSYSDSLLSECIKCHEDSKNLRDAVEAFMLDAINRMNDQARAVEAEFNSRITCFEELLNRFISELGQCLSDLATTENRIRELRETEQNLRISTKVIETRLHLRSQREKMESCDDRAQKQLLADYSMNQESIGQIFHYIGEGEAHRNDLRTLRERLESEIMLKRRALFQDRERCRALRNFYQSREQMLSQINDNPFS